MIHVAHSHASQGLILHSHEIHVAQGHASHGLILHSHEIHVAQGHEVMRPMALSVMCLMACVICAMASSASIKGKLSE